MASSGGLKSPGNVYGRNPVTEAYGDSTPKDGRHAPLPDKEGSDPVELFTLQDARPAHVTTTGQILSDLRQACERAGRNYPEALALYMAYLELDSLDAWNVGSNYGKFEQNALFHAGIGILGLPHLLEWLVAEGFVEHPQVER